MLAEIISELTKENTNVSGEQVLAWAKRVKTQRAQSVVINLMRYKQNEMNRSKTENCIHLLKCL